MTRQSLFDLTTDELVELHASTLDRIELGTREQVAGAFADLPDIRAEIDMRIAALRTPENTDRLTQRE